MRYVLLAVGIAVVLSACTRTEVRSYNRVPDAQVDEAYVAPGVDFSRYSKLYAMPLEIYYPEGAQAPLPENLERMRTIFREAFLAEIGDDYEIVREPAKDALGVRASLVDFKIGEVPDELPVHGRLRSLVASGDLTFLMELSDSKSGEILARAADKEKYAGDAAGSGANGDWSQVEAAAARWARLFRNFLDNSLSPSLSQGEP